MQQTMHSYVCDINLRQESSLVLSDLHFAVFIAQSKYDIMRILSQLAFIPQTQESISCCMTFPDFYCLHRAVVFIIQPDVEHSSVW